MFTDVFVFRGERWQAVNAQEIRSGGWLSTVSEALSRLTDCGVRTAPLYTLGTTVV
jgi:hypothetical protein